VWFSKTGSARYISHLDLMRTMTRAFRRAEVAIWYTEGFNRHPYITFAAPLSLGFEGLRECMDFKLEDDDVSLEAVAAALDAVMPMGLRVLGATEAVMKVNRLGYSRYEMTFNCGEEVLRCLESAAELPVEKKGKKGIRTVDIRPLMEEMSVQGNLLCVTLPTNCESAINPALVVTALRALSGDEGIRAEVVRTAILADDRTEFV
jgi:radical SAM-linked protein